MLDDAVAAFDRRLPGSRSWPGSRTRQDHALRALANTMDPWERVATIETEYEPTCSSSLNGTAAWSRWSSAWVAVSAA